MLPLSTIPPFPHPRLTHSLTPLLTPQTVKLMLCSSRFTFFCSFPLNHINVFLNLVKTLYRKMKRGHQRLGDVMEGKISEGVTLRKGSGPGGGGGCPTLELVSHRNLLRISLQHPKSVLGGDLALQPR